MTHWTERLNTNIQTASNPIYDYDMTNKRNLSVFSTPLFFSLYLTFCVFVFGDQNSIYIFIGQIVLFANFSVAISTEHARRANDSCYIVVFAVAVVVIVVFVADSRPKTHIFHIIEFVMKFDVCDESVATKQNISKRKHIARPISSPSSLRCWCILDRYNETDVKRISIHYALYYHQYGRMPTRTN